MQNIVDIFISLGIGLLTLIKFLFLNAIITCLCMGCYLFYVFLNEKSTNKKLHILLFILMTAISIFLIYIWFKFFGIYSIIIPLLSAFFIILGKLAYTTDEEI